MIENPSDSRDAQDAAFLERVAGPLRSPEFLDETFEQRLMEKVRLEASLYQSASSTPRPRSWWRTERIVRVSPLRGLAVAAGLAGIIALSTLADNRNPSEPTVAAAPAPVATRSDTVHMVRFVFVDSRASTVELVGDFNAWTKGVTRLERTAAPGVWSASVALPPGRHEYAFIINGTRWIADPLAPTTSDDFGIESAVIHVGPSQQSAT